MGRNVQVECQGEMPRRNAEGEMSKFKCQGEMSRGDMFRLNAKEKCQGRMPWEKYYPPNLAISLVPI